MRKANSSAIKKDMGTKGDRHTSGAQLAVDNFLEKIRVIEGITSKKMFGGHGIFHNAKMFAIVDSAGQIFLKSDEDLANHLESLGSSQHGKMQYHSIPEQILDSNDQLLKYVEISIALSK